MATTVARGAAPPSGRHRAPARRSRRSGCQREPRRRACRRPGRKIRRTPWSVARRVPPAYPRTRTGSVTRTVRALPGTVSDGRVGGPAAARPARERPGETAPGGHGRLTVTLWARSGAEATLPGSGPWPGNRVRAAGRLPRPGQWSRAGVRARQGPGSRGHARAGRTRIPRRRGRMGRGWDPARWGPVCRPMAGRVPQGGISGAVEETTGRGTLLRPARYSLRLCSARRSPHAA